ncbi:DUF5590 domain-containing protein [Virgibacillus sp. 179-BFC.A HS]|uniref:DUF5590 domain-containing protein n=1 Tax=Tigheibacillus jepli TaxID=3035914 RepID=A0ABU5CHC5_9BACI|nr:DUF5590 domain-containing protein [Virgibacillus sp. 179-BFC.A HS]MDY0405723.1 DUF5590 domain-containing protein [Virgibacillus sp. 179-BFC.A HS]
MDYYQQEKRTWPSWLIWSLAVICILFVIAIVYGIILYKDIQQSKTAGMDATKKLVLHDTNVVHIDNIFLFHGDTRYHVVEGKTKDGKEAYVFVPKNKKNNKLTVVSETNIIAKDNMLQQWQNSCNQCQLINKNHPCIA